MEGNDDIIARFGSLRAREDLMENKLGGLRQTRIPVENIRTDSATETFDASRNKKGSRICPSSSSSSSKKPDNEKLDFLDMTILKRDMKAPPLRLRQVENNYNVKSDWSSIQRLVDVGICPGDRIEINRESYSHWGIYCGHCNIHSDLHFLVHLGVPLDEPKSRALSQFKNGEIRIDDLKMIAGVSLARINNEIDITHEPYPKEKVVARAIDQIGKNEYNLVLRNCECFTNWCRYGIEFSHQAYRGVSAAAACAGGASTGILGVGMGVGAVAGVGVGAVAGGAIGAVVGGLVIPIVHLAKAYQAKKKENRKFGVKKVAPNVIEDGIIDNGIN
ncbi:uncharacterized protein LOC141903984 [Tubulanus polymorphus]|uniref:uncharacterized protein LOC141903984 n=1 Tax=Tubulanus polymorphus TaxID=672921 RepID=UPI003DA30A59